MILGWKKNWKVNEGVVFRFVGFVGPRGLLISRLFGLGNFNFSPWARACRGVPVL